MKAYKVFNSDWKCRDFQFKVGETFEIKQEPIMCGLGFHACKRLVDCFSYYQFDSKNKVAEVELQGSILGDEEDKQVTNRIKIVQELTWFEVLQLVNSGKDNTGYNNSGDNNSGDNNSGDNNSGYRNSGDINSGDINSGDNNSGHRNSGLRNSGHRNSGNNNSGDINSGDINSGDNNSGDFNSNTPTIANYFNKPCNIQDWENSEKPDFIYNLRLNSWIGFYDMSDDEKLKYPKAYVCDGFLKTVTYQDAWKIAFDNRNENDLELLKALPNFDATIFEEITGINLNK